MTKLPAAVCLLLWSSLAWGQQPAPKELTFEPVGEFRKLPDRVLGASVEAFYEHLLDDPKKVEIAREMRLGFVRFPGGTDANYYDWRTGLFSIETRPDSSYYTRFWAETAPKIARAFPKGFHAGEYKAFADAIGAEVILIPNLETSSVEEQAAWFKDMASRGEVPHHIELGNEFWLAMVDDPNVIRRWPDIGASEAVVRKYLEAISPSFPEGARVAWQASGAAFDLLPRDRGLYARRLLSWDASLHAQPWFDAVTIHLYPRVTEVLGVASLKEVPRGAEGSLRVFRAMMARCDQGVHRVLRDIEQRAPGKGIWITEWNPRGADYRVKAEDSPVTPAILAHLAARSTFGYLAHPLVTASLFFMLCFMEDSPFGLYHSDGKGGYRPNATAVVLRWFNEAANGGAEYRLLLERGTPRVAGGGSREETYGEVEAGTFRRADGVTLLLQNASADARSCDMKTWPQEKPPKTIESISLPRLDDPADDTPEVRLQAVGGVLVLPPYSITRVRWE